MNLPVQFRDEYLDISEYCKKYLNKTMDTVNVKKNKIYQGYNWKQKMYYWKMKIKL